MILSCGTAIFLWTVCSIFEANARSILMNMGGVAGVSPAEGVAAYFTYRAVRTVRRDK